MGRHVTSLNGFVKILGGLEDKMKARSLFFRGHALKSFQTQPSIFRNTGHIENEHQMIRELLASHPREFQSDGSTFEKLVRAQHYGLPTRLLDVSRNPLVALYFACSEKPGETGQVLIIECPKDKRKHFDSDVVSAMSNLCFMNEQEKSEIIELGLDALKVRDEVAETDGVEAGMDACIEVFNKNRVVKKLVHFIRSEKPAFQPNVYLMDLVHVVAVMPRKLHPRILAQDGAFLLFGLFSFDKEISWMEDFEISKVDISGESKGKILSELASIGISKGALFPEIENSAQQITERYLI